MQYKIPIQIENEDTIFAGLSLRQIGIMLIGFFVAYMLFRKFQGQIPNTPLYMLCGLIIAVAVIVAKFKYYEMTFLPFLLNMIRLRLNGQARVWKRGIDSFHPLRLGYVKATVEQIAMKQPRKKMHEEQKLDELINHI